MTKSLFFALLLQGLCACSPILAAMPEVHQHNQEEYGGVLDDSLMDSHEKLQELILEETRLQNRMEVGSQEVIETPKETEELFVNPPRLYFNLPLNEELKNEGIENNKVAMVATSIMLVIFCICTVGFFIHWSGYLGPIWYTSGVPDKGQIRLRYYGEPFFSKYYGYRELGTRL